MVEMKAFWSYVHADDETAGGRISQLGRDIADEYEAATAESLELFLDTDAIQWGDDWRDRIDQAVESTAFFVPVLTPRYFQSVECRRECNQFYRRAEVFGVKELVLPIMYREVEELRSGETEDELIRMLGAIQWEDWTDLRHVARSSERYSRAVSGMVGRLVETNKRLEEGESNKHSKQIEVGISTGEDIKPGTLDLLARGEEALPLLVDTLAEITEEIQQVGELHKNFRKKLNEVPKGASVFAYRQKVARGLAHALSQPVGRIWSLSNTYSSHLYDVDGLFRAAISQASEADSNSDQNNETTDLIQNIVDLSEVAHESFSSIEEMSAVTQTMESFSRDLRPIMRQLGRGLVRITEGREVSDAWIDLIRESDLYPPPDDA